MRDNLVCLSKKVEDKIYVVKQKTTQTNKFKLIQTKQSKQKITKRQNDQKYQQQKEADCAGRKQRQSYWEISAEQKWIIRQQKYLKPL